MVELATALMVIQTISLTVGVIYYIITLQNSNRNQKHQLETRQAQLFMQIFSIWNNKEFWEGHNTVMKSDNTTQDYAKRFDNPEQFAHHWHVGTVFEGVGSLLHKGFINPVLVSDMLTSMSINYWEKVKPMVLEIRKTMPKNMEYAEYLAEEISRHTVT